jgi:predicted nucleotidyltransferase
MKIQPKFKKAIDTVRTLQHQDRYLGAFVFGSVARHEATDKSDLDVKIVIDHDSCGNINHPFLDGIKLDVSFGSFKQLEDMMDRQASKNERVPMIAESIILFDKTGKLKELKKRYQQVRPKKYTKADHQIIKFMAFHANDKIEKNLEKNEALALLGMHLNLNDIIKMHYQIRGRWYLGAKRIFEDLNEWDRPLSKLLRTYVLEKDTNKKFKIWTKMVDYVLEPVGGRQDVRENNCTCANCKRDLMALTNFQ